MSLSVVGALCTSLSMVLLAINAQFLSRIGLRGEYCVVPGTNLRFRPAHEPHPYRWFEAARRTQNIE